MSNSNHKVFTALTNHPVTAGMEKWTDEEYEDSIFDFAYNYHRSYQVPIPYLKESCEEIFIEFSDNEYTFQEILDKVSEIKNEHKVIGYQFFDGVISITVERELTYTEKVTEDNKYRNSVKAIAVLEEIYKELEGR